VPLLLLGVAGCSLLIPLDYTGGVVGAGAGGTGTAGSFPIAGTVGQDGGVGGTGAGRGGSAGQAGTSGGVAGTGPGATGGTGEGGSGDAGTGDAGGAPNGGAGAEAGAGEGGEPPAGSAGSAGMQGGTAGGGMGGVAGGGMGGRGGTAGAGGGCAGARPNADPLSCGPCGLVCAEGEDCFQGQCIASPCDKLCTGMTTSVTLPPNQGYKQNNVGIDSLCFEVTGYDPASGNPSFVCWNMQGRTIELNGANRTSTCDRGGQPITTVLRKGGYCVSLTAGTNTSAGFEFPN
jgi:hypothetical protein